MTSSTHSFIARPPVVVVVGHIDHGKSTLLDYIRKTNTVGAEAGGITQRLSAYEVVHKTSEGETRTITFLDTPGHESFQKMRLRGAEVADIAVLIISAEDGVQAQTLEALVSVQQANIPCIVALNKIDKGNADLEKTKKELLEHGVYLEGLGGDVPWVAISAKTGKGVSELLDLLLLVADLQELKGNPARAAEGVVIEAHSDPKKGLSATLIIKDGTLERGMHVVAGQSISPVRIFENFQGTPIKEARFPSPVRVIGFDTLPETGSPFRSYESKKEAVQAASETNEATPPAGAPLSHAKEAEEAGDVFIVPIVLKADVAGSLDAIVHELSKLQSDDVSILIISQEVGAITEGDVKLASSKEDTLVLGFHTRVDPIARDTAERLGVEIHTFDVIYELSEWLSKEISRRKPQKGVGNILGKAAVLKTFSKTRRKQVVGGRVEEGSLAVGNSVRILRHDTEIGKGKITSLQQGKANTKRVSDGEFGAQVEAVMDITVGDVLEILASAHK